MNSLHSFGNGLTLEGEDGLTDDLDFGEPLFDRELLPAEAFFAERFFMGREPEGPFHGLRIVPQSALPSGPRTQLRCVIQSGMPIAIIKPPPARKPTPKRRRLFSSSVEVMLGA